MGQKTNSLIFRLGQTNSEWNYKYSEKNSEESSLFLLKNFEIQNYIDRIFKFYGLILQNFQIEQNSNSINIYIAFFEQKYKTKKLYLDNFKKHNHLKSSNKILYPINSKQLILFLNNYIINICLKLYFKNKTINLKTQNLNKKFENTINKNNNKLIYKKTLQNFKRFLKDPFFQNFIQVLFITVSQKNSSKLLAESLAYYFQKSKKKHNFLLFFIKTTLNKLINNNFSKILGIKITIVGRLNGAPRAKKKILNLGVIPLQSLKSSISYHNSVAYTQNGTFGIKVWICEKD